MKKTLISLAVATLATGAQAATVYSQDGTELTVGGRAEFRGDFGGKTSGEKIDGTMQNNSRFRLNVGGTTEITEALSGFGFYEAEQGVKSSADNESTKDFKQRYLFAGLKSEMGAVSFGRQDTAAVQISQMSDVTTFTGAQKEFINAGNEQINNTILYTGEFDALTVKASYIAGEEKHTDGYGVSGIYRLPFGLGIGLGYSANDNNDGNGNKDGKSQATIAGLNYTFDALYLGATYTKGDINDKANQEFEGMEFAAIYAFTDAFSLKGAYQNTEIKDGGVKYNATDFFELTGDYAFNKNLNAYMSYLINNLDKEDIAYVTTPAYDVENTLRLGLKYSF
ncbi:porin [Vibrio sp.]|uniref:porin n=1 Tax=Vibrio sp. TaxID=678 RepID=UPI003D127BBE